MTAMREKPDPFSGFGRISLFIGAGIVSKLSVDLVVAAHFGLGAQTDAFFVAYTMPLIIEALIYPACQSGLVPVFVRQLSRGHCRDERTIFSTLFNLGLLFSIILLLAGIGTAPWLARLLAPGLPAWGYALTLRLMRILFLGTLIVGPVGVMRAFLNAHTRYTAPAMLELVRGTAVLAMIAIAYRRFGIEAVAWGYVVGGLLQFAMLAGVIALRVRPGYSLTIRLRLLRLTQAGRLFSVPLADYAFGQTILIAERVIGSFMAPGGISAINYGHRLASVAAVVLFGGLEVVSLSSLAADFAAGTRVNLDAARHKLIASLRVVLIVGISIGACVLALSFRLVQLLFERGAFDHQGTLLAAPVLGVYALSIPFYGYWLLLRNYLLAALRLTKVLLLSGVSAGVNIVLAVILSQYMGPLGVASAYVAGTAAVFFMAFLVVGDDIKACWKATLRLVSAVTVASSIVGVVLYIITNRLSDLLSTMPDLPIFVARLSVLFAAAVCAALLFPGILAVLQVQEAQLLLKLMAKRR